MKLSISLPDNIAKEIGELAKSTQRSVSWWIHRAWLVARSQLRNGKDLERAEKRALAKLQSIQGSLKKHYPHLTSVRLSHQAFKLKK